MELKEIQNLIKFVAKSGASEVKLEMGDVKITIKTGSDDGERTTIVQQMPMGMQQQPQMQQPQQQPMLRLNLRILQPVEGKDRLPRIQTSSR